ncbi:SDR family NAD(P)-dependent oxidoreductase [Paenibacillus pasadenensis]|uniref:SDR family NAD(P)-dependent oxidoreductase n=1 Tax=Paenibacillus pasadenensis TaxID=217090 RepID=UPI0020400782|nr:SDR family NAD(P)-dependent oxidoreductase [Paenibacillus pasadenensis]MCM3746403.1 SDR family NAD(P)-dependent oxidoreductase [Paenibacillus pasadenensis]
MKTNLPDLAQLRLRSVDEPSTAAIREVDHQDIAVIGVFTRFPMARNTDAFWQNIKNGVSCVSKLPKQREEDADRFIKFADKPDMPYADGAYLEDIDAFDYSFFNIPPKEAQLMNPRQRLFLETAWNVLEDAGYGPQQLAGSSVGIYVGNIGDVESYVYKEMVETVDPALLSAAMPGNLSSIIPSRISYLLNLKGPSLTVDTACSSSLIAVDLACHALRRGDCDMAMAGAVRLNLLPQNKDHAKLGIESTDDETRAFDDGADGSGMGEGSAAVLLKPLSKARRDGDPIYCVIKGSASNQDGASMGITAPNPAAQTAVLTKAWQNAGIDPATLGYIETHGTGTKLGDPIEIEGISKAFAKFTDKKQFCAIGSVKTNIGHLYDCAGIAGLIKAALSLKHQLIPPSIHFHTPNKRIPFIDSPVYVNTSQQPWPSGDTPRRCGVSSFGLSGTNCHVVLEEYIPQPVRSERNTAGLNQQFVIPLSAKSETSLNALLSRMRDYAAGENTAVIQDVAYTLSTGRDHHPHRVAIRAGDMRDLKNKLQQAIRHGLDLSGFSAPWWSYGAEPSGNDAAAMTQQSTALLRQLKTAGEQQGAELLQLIAELYTSGASLKWELIFQGSNARKISLPVYPFETKRSWLQIPELAPAAAPSSLFYSMTWIEEARDQRLQSLQGETVLIVGEWDELTHQLEQEGVTCLHVKWGERYQALSPRSFTVSGNEDDYVQLAEAIKHAGFTKIVHLLSYNRPAAITSPEKLNESQSLGVYSLFFLVRELLRKGVGHKQELMIVSDYASRVTGEEAVLKPENAPLVGLGKVIGIEYPHLTCRAIDVDATASARVVVEELRTDRTTYQIAYRNGKRYAEMMVETDVEQAPDLPVNVKEDGVYVITGGAGNLGLHTAKYLASKGRVNLALLNRTPLPEQAEWAAMMQQHDGSRLHKTVEKLLELTAAGAKVDCIAVDVASVEELRGTMERLRQTYGKINGVIHAAGVAGRGFLIRKDTAVFQEVLSPKVFGTWALDQATEQDELDFFVLFSSGVSLVGEMGQGDYTAANSYLDAFADYRRSLGKPVHAINWVVWDGARMGEGKSETIDGIFKALSPSVALHALDQVLNKNVVRVLVGEVNTANPSGLELFSKDVFHLPAKLRAVFNGGSHGAAQPAMAVSPSAEAPKVKLLGSDLGAYTDVEERLASLYREVLGYEELSIHDTFFELGGDSVQLHGLHKLVERHYPGRTSIADLFAYASISRLASFLTREEKAKRPAAVSKPAAQPGHDEDMAIIGMAALFPGAGSVEQYWKNVSNAVDCTGPIPPERRAYVDDYLAAAGQYSSEHPGYMELNYLDGVDEFDYRFFRISPKEASLTDPGQRLFMQTAWQAMEDAGYGGDKLRGSRTGIYVGYANVIRDSYQRMLTDVDPVLMSEAIVGNVSAMIPTRISHLLDLKGPTMVVDTACSSSLVAVHMASNAIRSGDCDMALVGGIKLFLIPLNHDHNKIGIESHDGKTRAFDAHADGSGNGEGIASIVIKPLRKAQADGDHIHAVIKGSAINQDGTSMGITAPNPAAQTDVILRAWEKAGIHPESIAFFEAHGTGTELGDPIEISGLKQAIETYTDKKQFIPIGSVKSNIGHLNEGAGMASIIKAVMALKNREIPPTLYFQEPNSNIDLHDSPLYINTQTQKWADDSGPMRCAISSFGLSGTNGHLIIEEYRPEAAVPEMEQEHPALTPPYVLTLSAASESSLARLVKRYASQFKNGAAAALADICFTANTGRGHYTHRLALISADAEDLFGKLQYAAEQLEPHAAEGVYYGVHRTVSDRRSIRNPGDITEAEKSELRQNSERLLQEIADSGVSRGRLEQLCQLYAEGADVSWEQLYAGQSHTRVQLPVYPFERTKCWVEFPKRAKQPTKAAASAAELPAAFTMGWKPQRRIAAPVQFLAAGVTVIVKDKGGYADRLASALEAQGRGVFLLETPSAGSAVELSLEKAPAAEADMLNYYKQQLQQASAGRFITRIIHCTSLESRTSVAGLDELKRSQLRGTFSLFLLMKAWAACEFENDLELVVLTECAYRITGQEKQLRPEHAPLHGLAKALPKEHPHITCRCIDIDGTLGIEELLSEVTEGSGARLAAYRNGRRYVELFQPVNNEEMTADELTVRTGGIYLITGGTGGIGLETARWLSGKGRINLVLANRSAMPERMYWDKLLESGEDRLLCERIVAIREIEAGGSVVILYQCNVADEAETASMLADIRLRFGEIRGIVHGAGIVRTEPLAAKSLHTFQQVVSAKIYGTWLLDRLTQQDELDFFVMYSSVATLFETGDQSDYLAANAYLDAYSAMPSNDGRRRITINWSTWRDKGMAADNKFQVDTMFKTIQAADAMAMLDKVWSTTQHRALIGELNLESRMALWLNNYAIELAEPVKAALETLRARLAKTSGPAPADKDAGYAAVKLLGNEQDAFSETEQQVAQACKEVLGFAEIDIHENFFEMGADSLMIRQIYQKLAKLYPEEAYITDLFEYPTVYKLARHLDKRGAGLQDTAPAVKREALQEDDLNRMFDELDSGAMDIGQMLSKLGSKKR